MPKSYRKFPNVFSFFTDFPKKVFLPLNILLVYKESLSGLSNQANSGLFAVGTPVCVCVTVFVQ